MWLVKFYYRNIKKTDVPYYVNYSIIKVIAKPFRKILIHNIAPSCPFNSLRVQLYRMAGFNIGKKVFIGMQCYIDDMEPSLITIKDNAIISFKVTLCVHGRNQKHNPIVIEKNAYIGCCSTILAHNNNGGLKIGENAVIGACSFVNKSVPANITVVGVPAKELKH
jgi:acetyltransferase-like isoleucine patch superfamily enzyme